MRQAQERLIHRGPDRGGLYISTDKSCALGSRRLSIIDLSAAADQPMTNEDKTLWLVFNGEIYNHQNLRQELAHAGHRFRSSSDTEVILHLYEEHGAALLSYLDGIFSFVIYDESNRRVFGARDRLGVKPLYYALSSRRFAFASEPKALLAMPDVGRDPRVEEVPSYLTYCCVPGPHTLFRDIEKLEPATLFELTAEGMFTKKRYWLPGHRIVGEPMEPVDLENDLARSLSRAVAKRTVCDVELGTTLSGGVDSSIVVALMTELGGAPVKTFTIGYPGDTADPHSDIHHARLVARHFGTDHHELIVDHNDFLAVLEDDLAELADDPIGSPSQAAIVHLAKFARRNGIKVIQVGEGSDELFCGYNSVYQLWRFHERLGVLKHLLPRWFAGFLCRAFESQLEWFAVNPSNIGSIDGTLPEHLRRYSKGQHLYWGYGLLFCAKDCDRLYRKALASPMDPYERLRLKMVELPGLNRRPYLDQLAMIDLLLQLPERLLMRVDKATMRYGVEAREPFLDMELMRMVFDTPAKIRAAGPKGFLKAYARQKLSPEILARAKRGFPTDSRIFMSPQVLSKIRESILSKRFVDFTGFDPSRLKEFVAVSETGQTRYFHHVWAIFILSLWFHRWVDARASV